VHITRIFVLLVVFAIFISAGAGVQAQDTAYSESPALADQVAAGSLPPVAERLPTEPLVVVPNAEVGQYGGTLRTWWGGPGDEENINNHLRYNLLVRMNHNTGFEVFPDVADQWEVSEDGTTFTFRLREGLKWSDGTPMTTEDVAFWWNDIILNEEYTPEVPSILRSGGEPGTLEVVDAQTFTITFAQPYGSFLITLGTIRGRDLFISAPKHYLSQFHPAYADADELTAAVSEAGLETWVQLFEQRSSWLQNPELPQLTAWVVESSPDSTGRTTWVRNPYYYKVDSDGKQLPYIDRIEISQIDSVDVALLRAANGEIDLQIRGYDAPELTPLSLNAEQGNYTVVPYFSDRGSQDSALQFNQTVNDPVLREIFADVRFRQAVSLAINRDEVNQVGYLGLGIPRQASFTPANPYFSEEWANSFIEYNPDQANQLLDAMGLTERNDAGIRLRPDGEPLEIIFESPSADPWHELLIDYFENIGISLILQPRDGSLYRERIQQPDFQFGLWTFNGDFFNMRRDLLPAESRRAWGNAWAVWFETGGDSGEEPPAELQRVAELINLAYQTPDEQTRAEYIAEIAQIHQDNLWQIGLVGLAPRAGVVSNQLRNVPTDMPYGSFLPIPAIYTDQFFFANQ
jgi:peptide/nickel transport system substrate-binding protein